MITLYKNVQSVTQHVILALEEIQINVLLVLEYIIYQAQYVQQVVEINVNFNLF